MTKLTIADLVGDMPEEALVTALDDNRDFVADESAFAAALASANERAEAVFGGTIPERYTRAADYAVRVFLLDLLYRRLGNADGTNPWASRAEDEARHLRALANGTEAIDSTSDGVVISKPAHVYNSSGVMS